MPGASGVCGSLPADSLICHLAAGRKLRCCGVGRGSRGRTAVWLPAALIGPSPPGGPDPGPLGILSPALTGVTHEVLDDPIGASGLGSVLPKNKQKKKKPSVCLTQVLLFFTPQ